ncbi:MAPEG family protein [Pseudomonas cichorii]|uniref:MAPEG family protein n=1 Tax=Pseudomonas lijiangensis TaxID=2995658 RepID=A0ABX8HTR6_9PSED|nr:MULTISPECIES: MAPEG family protein [Pseudomonas syringae group]MBX8491091.1 MAPEG family protein [Pseudomonas cichorii]MBX8501019.1 MAPEG family protein [Pseudomonas lijiangensis]MBX8505674.1 MAPEG family protein [Pseudomonas lijiangensis]MBX8511148.1 MAPEG family protein [Pseudomonas cichorii]MBX8525862.1 MAPEG family protein [Pseudomonas cichorii]
MTVAFWCVLIAIILPIVCAGIAKIGSGRYNNRHNHDPRSFLDSLGGFPKRAHAAQLNSYEITPAFAAAVIIAHIAGNAQLVTIDVLAVLFITSRLLYIIFYVADLATMRSVVWLIGLGAIVGMFVASAFPAA